MRFASRRTKRYGRRTRSAYNSARTRTRTRYSRTRRMSSKRSGGSLPQPASKRIKRTGYGDRMSRRTTKAVELFNETTPLDVRTLYNRQLTLINQTATNIQNTRTGQVCNLYGVRLNMIFRNALQFNCCYNIAIVTLKPSCDFEVANFFRSDSTTRGLNFDVSRSGNEMRHLPINSDKYNVLYRKKGIINRGDAVDYYSKDNKNWIVWDKYIKIKRQVEFTDTLDTSCRDKMILCFWFDWLMATPGNGPSPMGNFQGDATLYFKDVQG